MQNARFLTKPTSILALVGALSTCLAGTAAAQNTATILAGDYDTFGFTNDQPDKLVIRKPLKKWLKRNGGNNRLWHKKKPMPFDADQWSEGKPHGPTEWDFGYTFENLPPLAPDAMLRIHLKSMGSYDDSIYLQYTGNGHTSTFLWSASIDVLHGQSWNNGDDAIFEIPLGNLPITGGCIIGDINAAGSLDVVVTDDTSVNWIELVHQDCYGDYNGDGIVDTRDFIAYLNDWMAGNGSTDCNCDGVINSLDGLCFLNAWSSGC